MSTQDGWFHRGPRPSIGWVVVALCVICFLFLCVVLFAVAAGFLLTAARGQAVPDMTGGLGNLAAFN